MAADWWGGADWYRPEMPEGQLPRRIIGPEQTPEVLRVASQRATAMRRARGEIKRQLKSGAISLDALLHSQPGDNTRSRVLESLPQVTTEELDYALEGMRVFDLIRGVPGVGNVRAERLMSEIDISPKRKVRGLGTRQRQQLIDLTKAAPA